MKMKKLLSIILSLSMLIAICIFPVKASSGSVTELNHEEDTRYTTDDEWYLSDTTYDDYDSYGFLSNSSDVDWWEISHVEDGMANFYLQSPSGCDYSMQIYKYINSSVGLQLIVTVTNGAVGGYDLARIHVEQAVYYVKIYSTSGSSANNSYLFRTKNYPDKKSYLSTIVHNASNSSTTPLSNYCRTHITNDGFNTVYDVYNQTAAQTFTQLKNSDIHVIYGEAYGNSIIRMQMVSGIYSYLAGQRHAALNSNSFAISDYSNGDLSETDLIVFAASKSGATNSAYGNLVDQAMAKGCYCAIGWIGEFDQLSMLIWLNGFFEFTLDYSVAYSMTKMDYAAEQRGISIDDKQLLTNRYYNTTKAYYLYLNNNDR